MDTIKRVQDLMQVRDMNLCVLAKKCGISYSTIQTTARRGGQLSVETIERICQGLGITLKDFFDSYNEDCQCHAGKISVEGSDACHCEGTECATFQCR